MLSSSLWQYLLPTRSLPPIYVLRSGVVITQCDYVIHLSGICLHQNQKLQKGKPHICLTHWLILDKLLTALMKWLAKQLKGARACFGLWSEIQSVIGGEAEGESGFRCEGGMHGTAHVVSEVRKRRLMGPLLTLCPGSHIECFFFFN